MKEEEEELGRIVRRRPWQESVVDALLTAEYHPLNLALASRQTVHSLDAVANHCSIELVGNLAMNSNSTPTQHDECWPSVNSRVSWNGFLPFPILIKIITKYSMEP